MNNELTKDAGKEDEVEALLQKIRTSEDPDAFEALCRMYANLLDSMVKQFAPSLGINSGGADEAVSVLGIGPEELRQDASMALYKAARSYVPDEDGKGKNVSFGLYAKICIRNAMISEVRRYKRQRRRQEAEQARAQAAGKSREPVEAEILAGETMRRIREQLSGYENEILPLYLEGKPPREIAGILGRTEKSVSNGIYRIKTKIRQMLEMR